MQLALQLALEKNAYHACSILVFTTTTTTIIQVREKAFREMKKDVGMTTAQKSKETRRMEMGSIFVLYIQPTIPTYYTYITAL